VLLLGRYHGLEHRERLPTDDGIGSGAASDSRACRGIIFDTCCAAACTSAAGKSRYACAQLCRWSLSYYRLVYSTVRLARLLQARRRRRTGHRSVCESRLSVPQRRFILPGSLCACACVWLPSRLRSASSACPRGQPSNCPS